MAKNAKAPVNPAKKQNQKVITQREKTAKSKAGVFAHTLAAYKKRLPDTLPSDPGELQHLLLHNLTDPLVSSYPDALASIRARMEKKWEGHADAAAKVEASVANSKKRSAGTNFQSLVSYALAKYLLETDSAWFVAHPVPKEFRESLAITFTAGIPLQGDEVSPAPPAEVEEAVEEMLAEDNEATAGGEDDKEEGEEQDVADDAETLATVNPDVDILLRNANWLPALGKREPV